VGQAFLPASRRPRRLSLLRDPLRLNASLRERGHHAFRLAQIIPPHVAEAK
jgi:hypothetical protein